MNVSKWVYNFKDLDPDNQLKVAEGIMQELKDNETLLDEEDGYDKEKSHVVRVFFAKMIAHEKDVQALRHLNEQIQAYDRLTPANKMAFCDGVLNLIDEYIDKQVQEEKEAICKKEGHTFGHWQQEEWTTYENVSVDYQVLPIFDSPVNHKQWVRTCKRCGYQEETVHEPKSVAASRRRRENTERIKALEEELRQLKKGRK